MVSKRRNHPGAFREEREQHENSTKVPFLAYIRLSRPAHDLTMTAKEVIAMRLLYIFWNLFWWNRHVGTARKHDMRMQKLDPNWKGLLGG
mgnify:FL=1